MFNCNDFSCHHVWLEKYMVIKEDVYLNIKS